MSFAQHPTTTTDWRDIGRVTVDILLDDGLLLAVLNLYKDKA